MVERAQEKWKMKKSKSLSESSDRTWASRMLHFTQKPMMDKEGDIYSTKNGYKEIWKVEVEAKTNIDWNKLE